MPSIQSIYNQNTNYTSIKLFRLLDVNNELIQVKEMEEQSNFFL